MGIQVCSLKNSQAQTIPPGDDYTVVRFPFDAAGESYDRYGMHQPDQPDDVQATYADPRSGLIWPSGDGWGSLTAMLHWEDGSYTETRDRFVRDPLGLFGTPDSTATEDHAATSGGNYHHKSHEMFVHPGTPVGLLVRHNSARPLRLTFAEFKLAIHSLD